jgi:hypothetical protein
MFSCSFSFSFFNKKKKCILVQTHTLTKSVSAHHLPGTDYYCTGSYCKLKRNKDHCSTGPSRMMYADGYSYVRITWYFNGNCFRKDGPCRIVFDKFAGYYIL